MKILVGNDWLAEHMNDAEFMLAADGYEIGWIGGRGRTAGDLMRLRYGGERRSYRECGDEWGVSGERIKQMMNRVSRWARHPRGGGMGKI